MALSALDQANHRIDIEPHILLEKRAVFEFGLQQYNQGIKILQYQVAKSNHAVLLTGHLLIAFLEKWLNEHTNAERGSLAIAKLLETGFSSTSDDPESTMIILGRLVHRELAEFAHVSTVNLPPSLHAIIDLNKSLEPFNSIEHASEHLQDTYESILSLHRVRHPAQPAISLQRLVRNAESLLQRWYTPFCALRTRVLELNDPYDMRHILLMDLRYNILNFACITLLFPRHEYPTRCTEIFEDLLVICKKIWEIDKQLFFAESSVSFRSFAPDTGIIMCLHLLTLLSTNSSIRRQALRLLYRIKKVEGNFASDALAVISEHVIQIEEGVRSTDPLPTDVSFEDQIQLISTTYHTQETRSGTKLSRSCGNIQPTPNFSDTGGTAWIEFQWIRSADQQRQRRESSMMLAKHQTTSLIRSRSAHWWPVDSTCLILEDELGSEERKRDGPHLGFKSFTDRYDFSFESICRLWVLHTGSRKGLVPDASSMR